MITRFRAVASVAAIATIALLMAGCAESSNDEPTSTTSAAPAAGTNSTPSAEPTEQLELDVAWLENGRMVGLITTGSSTCVPAIDDIAAEGQSVSVTLDEGDSDQPCTADLVPRASVVMLPAGVDQTQDVELTVTLGSATGEATLAGSADLTGIPGEETEFQPSAGWFNESALVLVTWGSSSCPPIVDSIDTSGQAGTVTFTTEERACTMDMQPRTTIVDFAGVGEVTQEGFVLTLVGDNLDGTVNVQAGG